jgi:hypothetical protein
MKTLRHTPQNCKTCEPGERLKDNELFKALSSFNQIYCAKCSELLMTYVRKVSL